jgi:hypothetical protein
MKQSVANGWAIGGGVLGGVLRLGRVSWFDHKNDPIKSSLFHRCCVPLM